MAEKFVFFFGDGKAEGTAKMKDLLGGKGANLAEMTNLGMPVPPGLTVSTRLCTYFYAHGRKYPAELKGQIAKALNRIEAKMKSKFGDETNPLLCSVRSGARVSMPGMMDTILNLGLNDRTVQGLIKQTDNERFAYDCYRRFVQMYGDVVMGLKPHGDHEIDPFEEVMDNLKKEKSAVDDTGLSAEALRELVRRFKSLIKERTGKTFPEDPAEQLWGAIGAVFGSWENPRAVAYRKLNDIPSGWGTAVNVQAMVYGNMGATSGTGVAFTRNPATGEKEFYGEYLLDAQGEDVVAGVRTPQPISRLKEEMPQAYKQLLGIARKLEKHYRDMQDIEFTIQKGTLWMLQTRSGKRTGFASVNIAVDMAGEGLISEKEAILRVEPDQLNHLLRPVLDPADKEKARLEGRIIAKGLNAGPGGACGKVVFSARDAQEWASQGETVILARIETSPEDIKGMDAAAGILTQRGGMTSHAALVARQMGKVCVAGCGEISMDYSQKQMKARGKTIKQGDFISLDGFTGEVIEGNLQTKPSEILQVIVEKTLSPGQSRVYQRYAKLMKWADKYRRLGIRTNADLPDQAQVAIAFGAEGIGLCRTEHMFFGENRIDAVRQMILAGDAEGRKKALLKLLPMQKKDFAGLFEAMGGRPVTIRTLDPPLHEFLPGDEESLSKFSSTIDVPVETLRHKLEELREVNPMLGHRGCRLGIVYPEITEMQARAILEAACEAAKKGKKVRPEIMIPLVGHANEFTSQAKVVRETAKKVFAEQGKKVDYSIGTMIELPRAALTADEIAQTAEFFSFGTNDLTQTTYGLSRDDAGKFLNYYYEMGILSEDPFQTVDQRGVGLLMKIGVEKGRSTRRDLKIGICGEHGGDPKTVDFCHKIGLDYVSCSPFRVPIARLAAARAALNEGHRK